MYTATVVGSDRQFVVKVAYPDPDLNEEAYLNMGGTDESTIQAFQREIEMMTVVGRHPSVIEIVGATQDSSAIVFERALCDLGEYLILNSQNPVDLTVARGWSESLLAGVAFMHEREIVHRDLKPCNLLLMDGNVLKIADFGFAREGCKNTMRVSRELCTVSYRAPELIMGAPFYDANIDEWSVGVTILEILVGVNPLSGGEEEDADGPCSCRRTLHCNYHGAQLLRIFSLCGTPPDEVISKMACRKHFQDWPAHRNSLDEYMKRVCGLARFESVETRENLASAAGSGAITDAMVAQSCLQEYLAWMEVLRALLIIVPEHRMSAEEALRLRLFHRIPQVARTSTFAL